MKKKDWIYIICLLLFEAGLYGVGCLFSDNVEYRIVLGGVFFVIWLGFSVGLVLYRVLTKRGRETLEIKLSRQGFNIQKSFNYSNDMGANVTVYFDFDSKQFASNLLYNAVIPFSRVSSGRVEIRSYGANSNKSTVRYVISIRRKSDDNNYDYIEMFDTVVDNCDLSGTEEITEQMVAKYNSLKDIIELDNDVQRIIEINKSDGFVISAVTDDEWQQSADSDEIDHDSSENSDPHYTKPPFSDKKW